MSKTQLGAAELQAFFENVALMMSVGVQTEEAVHLLITTAETDELRAAAEAVYAQLVKGTSLARAMEAAGCFPAYALKLVEAGEQTGHGEETLRTLAAYYDEEDRLFAKLRQAIGYPCILLSVLSVILIFLMVAILPVFSSVYGLLAGGIAGGTYGLMQAGVVIGAVALVVTLIFTLLALIAFVRSRSDKGRAKLMRTAGKWKITRQAFYELALSRFTSALAVYTAAGMNVDDAVGRALEGIDNEALRARVARAHRSMLEPVRANGLVQAFASYEVFDAQHIRMLTFGMRTGRLDEVLSDISQECFQDAIAGFDALVDKVEPALAGFVTLAVGASLISVMLPLVNIMGAIG